MNTLIETLNRWGADAVHFAWPMLWQSAVLIAVLFAADLALRGHVRAAVRHALWLVLLVKLLLPPSLALPTSPAWWLHSPAAASAKQPARHFTVSDSNPAPTLPPEPAPVYTPPPVVMSASAWLLVAWTALGLGLLGWLFLRWHRVACDARRAVPAPVELEKLFNDAKSSLGMRQSVGLRVTDQAMSPAVCGLFRPVILLPRPLVDKLAPAQLRAVLLHELIHLRRGDVWTNCFQALIQIAYWWHPLLWPANARIRRVREEAVDDAVMLALRGDAEVYAPTLLEVARLAFERPLAGLGLVGILESRSALRQRIERLVEFRAPNRAGLTVASFLGVCIFSAVALPMGEAPTSADKQPVAPAAQPEQTLTVKVNPEVFIRNVKAQAGLYLHDSTNDYGEILLDILRGEGVNCLPPHGLAFNTKTGEITTQNTPEQLNIFRQVIEQLNRPDGQCNLLAIPIHRKGVLIQGEIYKMRTADFDDLMKGLHRYDNPHFSNLPWWLVEPDQFAAFSNHIQSLGLHPLLRPRIQTSHGRTAQLYYGNETNSIELSCLPYVTVDQTQRFVELTVQANTTGWFTDNPVGDWPVRDGTNRYAVSGQVSAEDHGGIVLRAKNPAGENLVVILGIQILTNDASALKPASGVNAISLVRGESRKNIAAKLDRIRLNQVSWPDGLPLSEVLRNLSLQTKLCDPDKKGINFTFQTNAPTASAVTASAGGATTINPITGLPEATPAGVAVNPSSINVKLTLTDIRLGDLLDAIVLVADYPIKYSILDDGIVFSTGSSNSAPLETRTFKVDANVFLAALQKQTGLQTDVAAAMKQLLSNLGVELSPPKTIFFNDRLGMLFVRATPQDLDTVEKTVITLSYTPPPQIHIKVRFLSMPKDVLATLDIHTLSNWTNDCTRTGIISPKNARTLLKTLQTQSTVESLAEPEVTTVSGRQTQMRATEEMCSIIVGPRPEALMSPGIASADTTTYYMKTEKVEIGPVIDVIPHVLNDGYTIDLTVIPSLTEFLGYDNAATNQTTIYVNGHPKQVTIPRPKFVVSEMRTHIALWDQQTVLLDGGTRKVVIGQNENTNAPAGTAKNQRLLVLITATLVDSAGNPIHSQDDILFAKDSVPPQQFHY